VPNKTQPARNETPLRPENLMVMENFKPKESIVFFVIEMRGALVSDPVGESIYFNS
jgi:hypothetical protein